MPTDSESDEDDGGFGSFNPKHKDTQLNSTSRSLLPTVEPKTESEADEVSLYCFYLISWMETNCFFTI
jgi:hypothetical protein